MYHAGVTPSKPIGAILRDLRESRGESLRQAAHDLGVDAAHLSRLERGIKTPSQDLRARAADYYDVPSDDLAVASGVLPEDIVELLLNNEGLIDELRARDDLRT